MNVEPMVSVVIPTFNSIRTIERCLRSVRNQSYKHVEIIVVDGGSTDGTVEIARQLADKVIVAPLRRSAARNRGVREARGEFVLILDSDMYVTDKVISECVARFTTDEKGNNIKGIVIPEKSIGKGFLAKVKALEREFYQGVEFMEAARFFPRKLFIEMGGYDECLDAGEDWELSQRIREKGSLPKIRAIILHDEGALNLRTIWQKKQFYGRASIFYLRKKQHYNYKKKQFGFVHRISIYFSKPLLAFKHPILWPCVFLLKGIEFLAWRIGQLTATDDCEQDYAVKGKESQF